jgi:hypothetical protein
LIVSSSQSALGERPSQTDPMVAAVGVAAPGLANGMFAEAKSSAAACPDGDSLINGDRIVTYAVT